MKKKAVLIACVLCGMLSLAPKFNEQPRRPAPLPPGGAHQLRPMVGPRNYVVVPKSDIETRTQSAVSMMPEGIFSKLKDDEVRDLISYLASPSQVPLPTGKDGK